jgi:hypothetical protein
MGVAVVTTVLLPPESYLLTTLAMVKLELQIDAVDTSKDAILAQYLAEASDDVHLYCNRTFPQETVQDRIFPQRDAYPYQVPGGVPAMQLSRWPIVAKSVTLPTAADTPSGPVLPFASTAGVAVGQPVAIVSDLTAPPNLRGAIWNGTFVASLVANTSVTLSQPVRADVPAATAITFGIAVAVVDQPGEFWHLAQNERYLVDQKAGHLIHLDQYTYYPVPWYPVQTLVTYQGGFATIPNDLVGVVLRLITDRYASRGRDPALKSQDQPGLGMQSWWVGNIPGVRGAFPEEIADRLNRYRVPVAG